MIKRTFDIALSLPALLLLSPLMLAIALAIRLESTGPAIFWSQRFGANGRLFAMPKFRSMRLDAPQVATHLLKNSELHLTGLGPFLRKTSLDELPQLWSVLKGDMSLVGPRPALFNQADLMEMRCAFGIHRLRPGVTGLAQVYGRDSLELHEKIAYEAEYFKRCGFFLDLLIIAKTVGRVFAARDVSH
jgi:O-antigen biosynthesis protein WbqP